MKYLNAPKGQIVTPRAQYCYCFLSFKNAQLLQRDSAGTVRCAMLVNSSSSSSSSRKMPTRRSRSDRVTPTGAPN